MAFFLVKKILSVLLYLYTPTRRWAPSRLEQQAKNDNQDKQEENQIEDDAEEEILEIIDDNLEIEKKNNEY